VPSINWLNMPSSSDEASFQSSELATVDDLHNSFLQTPLLSRQQRDMISEEGMRHRATGDDVEQNVISQTPHGNRRHRILDRSGNFRQSRGRWGVDRQNHSGSDTESRWHCLCLPRQEWRKDWFFRLAYQKTIVLFLLLFVSYGLIIVFFGFIYLALSVFGSKAKVNPDGSTETIAFCDMDINNHMEAMYFSLSTMTTIGYGVSDYYFGGCYSPFLIVLWQVCTAVVFDAVAVGLIFHRISRGAKRSQSIIFSDKAVIRRVRRKTYFMFRLGERRKYNLIDATVRCYCVRHERIPLVPPSSLAHKKTDSQAKNKSSRVQVETTYFVSRLMRLIQPDDRFGSHVWMGLPQVVVHCIDQESPLLPPLTWYDAEGMENRCKSVDGDYRDSNTRAADPLAATEQITKADFESMKDFLNDRDAEIVVLVEGTDEGTGQNVQARHSYKASDIAWNVTFADCVYPYNRRQRRGPSSLDPLVTVDFSKFHSLVPAPVDCEECAYVPERFEVKL
jgi:potassium inwardly-rectifying channel subfamily J